MKTNEEDDEDQTRWMHVLYKAFAAFPHILTPLLVRTLPLNGSSSTVIVQEDEAP